VILAAGLTGGQKLGRFLVAGGETAAANFTGSPGNRLFYVEKARRIGRRQNSGISKEVTTLARCAGTWEPDNDRP
jgi:hypothetical protein